MNIVGKAVQFLSDVKIEMAKVSWPTYEDLKGSTIIVIVLSLLFVVFIFSTDWLLSRILQFIF